MGDAVGLVGVAAGTALTVLDEIRHRAEIKARMRFNIDRAVRGFSKELSQGELRFIYQWAPHSDITSVA